MQLSHPKYDIDFILQIQTFKYVLCAFRISIPTDNVVRNWQVSNYKMGSEYKNVGCTFLIFLFTKTQFWQIFTFLCCWVSYWTETTKETDYIGSDWLKSNTGILWQIKFTEDWMVSFFINKSNKTRYEMDVDEAV